MNYLGYVLFAWFLVILTGIGSVVFRRFIEHLKLPPEPPPPPPPVVEPMTLTPAERTAEAAAALKHEYHEKLDMIDSLPLPPEDKRALMNDEEEHYANAMRQILNRYGRR